METKKKESIDLFDDANISRRLSNDISYEKTKKLFKVFFVKKHNQPELIPYIHTTYKILCEKFQNRLYLEEEAYKEYIEYLKTEKIDSQIIDKKFVKILNPKSHINAIIIMGGDGTVLHACSLFEFQTTPPILAFNKGTLNFMCNYNFQEYEEIIEKIFSKMQETKVVKVDIRMRLDCKIYQSIENKRCINGHYSALNEIVIDRGSNPYPIKLEISINNEPFTTSQGDGIIISTPSGSSAYALSAGGPLIHTSVKTIEMIPICPLSLSFRPILFPDNALITIKLADSTRNKGFLSADGKKKFEVGCDDIIQISSSQHNVQIISEPPMNQLISIWGCKLQYMLNWNTKFEAKNYH